MKMFPRSTGQARAFPSGQILIRQYSSEVTMPAREPLQMAAVAREVDVHPGHLARAFRQHFRMPLGS